MDAQALRERRRARIQAGGAQRLSKITGTVHPDRKDYTDHRAMVKDAGPTPMDAAAGQSNDPPISVPGITTTTSTATSTSTSSSTNTGTSTFTATRSTAGSGNAQPNVALANNTTNDPNTNSSVSSPADASAFQDDPIFKLLSALNAGSMSEEGMSNPLQAFQSFFGSAMDMGGDGGGSAFSQFNSQSLSGSKASSGNGINTSTMTGTATSTTIPKSTSNQQAPTSTSDLAWTIIQMVMAVSLAFYAIGHPFEFNLLRSFIVLQFVLHSARFVIEKGAPPSNSFIVKWASFLPGKFRLYAITAARYIQILRSMARDFCLVMFVLGIYSLVWGN